MTDRDQLRECIEWVLGVHYRTSTTARGWLCACGEVVPAPEFDGHVADAVLDALQLEQVGTAAGFGQADVDPLTYWPQEGTALYIVREAEG